MYPEPDFTKEIVGGSLGGLALLALLTAGLYKVRYCRCTVSVYYTALMRQQDNLRSNIGHPLSQNMPN